MINKVSNKFRLTVVAVYSFLILCQYGMMASGISRFNFPTQELIHQHLELALVMSLGPLVEGFPEDAGDNLFCFGPLIFIVLFAVFFRKFKYYEHVLWIISALYLCFWSFIGMAFFALRFT